MEWWLSISWDQEEHEYPEGHSGLIDVVVVVNSDILEGLFSNVCINLPLLQAGLIYRCLIFPSTPVSQNSELRTQKMIYLIFNPNITFCISFNKYIKLINNFGLGRHLFSMSKFKIFPMPISEFQRLSTVTISKSSMSNVKISKSSMSNVTIRALLR